MRKAMAVVRLSENTPTYRVQYFKIVTREFVDIDFTDLTSDREYSTLVELCRDIINLAKINGYKIETAGEINKMPNILIDKGTGTLSKYVFGKNLWS